MAEGLLCKIHCKLIVYFDTSMMGLFEAIKDGGMQKILPLSILCCVAAGYTKL